MAMKSSAVLGDPAFGDRLERITYNALPATFKPDMWAHQYFQQANQVECTLDERRDWTTPWEDANLFGLEPAYGCCTAAQPARFPRAPSDPPSPRKTSSCSPTEARTSG